MDQSQRIASLVAPPLGAAGYELVRVLLRTGPGATLQIMVERADRAEMTVDDCARASRAVSAVLDVADPIRSSYALEVSSPGIDRPLTRLSDFSRFAGREARVESRRLIDGRRRFRGRLAGVDGETVRIEAGGDAYAVPFGDISAAKLVLGDEPAAPGGRGAGTREPGAEERA